MKKLQTLLIILGTIFILHSCKTNVDLFADYEETTIVYGLLDHTLDTNYIKITKSLTGNALENAINYEANNYDYKLYVRLIDKNKDSIALDTISVFKKLDTISPFYSGRKQLVYYTTKKLNAGETYKLYIRRKDGVVITSEAKTIHKISITKPIVSIAFDNDYTNEITWRDFDNVYDDTHASYYEVTGLFHYKQVNPGETDSIDYVMKWNMGSGSYDNLLNKDQLSIPYTPSSFFAQMAADDNIAYHTYNGVVRVPGKFEIVISAVGKELYNYILINNSNSAIQDTPEYTNINNGIGMFSTRCKESKFVKVSEYTKIILMHDYNWGFIQN